MYKIDRKGGGGGGSKNRILGGTRNIAYQCKMKMIKRGG